MSLISYYVTHLVIRARLAHSWKVEGKTRDDSKTAHAMLYLGCSSDEYQQYLGELLVAMAPSSTEELLPPLQIMGSGISTT
jgi:hypothetical protein